MSLCNGSLLCFLTTIFSQSLYPQTARHIVVSLITSRCSASVSCVVLYFSLVFDMLDTVCSGKEVFRCFVFFSHFFFFFFFCRGDEQLRFSVDEELAVPQTIAFVCWNCLTSCKPESGST